MAYYNLSIGAAFSEGWESTKKHGLMVAAVIVIATIITSFIQNLLGGFDPQAISRAIEGAREGDMNALQTLTAARSSIGASIGSFVGTIVSLVAYVGLYNFALGVTSGRFASFSFDVFRLPVQVYLKFVLVELLVGVIAGVSICCCIIPFFVVVPRLAFAGIYAIENPDAGIMECLSASWKMTADNWGAMILLGLAFFGLTIAGILCCCVGVYLADVINFFALIAAYFQLKGNLMQ